MPGPYREGTTYVDPYDYRRGSTPVHVKGHPTHYEEGTPEFLVLFREKNLREPGGSREHPRNRKYKWHLKGRYRYEATANKVRNDLMRRGYHAIVEGIGGRAKAPTLREVLEDANRADAERRRMRRE